ncbi:HupE/UreJ family protein [Paracoccus versutus]|uniref:Urease accessory protein n=1 Tax=Paracoccus versutus TaxID=34007 RepID=A0AAQ0KKR3_PARVE|nr:HupE/UreJ family protein [Paracoccus versutus]KGJ10381.1 urease accessory protein [Paracoccus versutus]REG43902.1 urease accessory protein [Paracoccus versutus]WEJ79565.1 HupE/UreJ family protein [Paracoccus versutus]
MKKLLAALLLAPTAALAHTGHGGGAPLVAGLSHPMGGADHLLAMLAVGLWAAGIGGRAIWALPLAFVAAMVAGGALGAAGVGLPLVEPVILASSIVIGAAIALALRPGLAMVLPVIAVFGMMHGHAHGIEGPAQGLAAYAAGFALATAGLHGIGIALGRLPLARWLGAATAAAGLALAVA